MWYVGPKSALLTEPLCWLSVLGGVTPMDGFFSAGLPGESSGQVESRAVLVAIQRGKIGKRLQSQIRKAIDYDLAVVVIDMRPKQVVEDLAINLGCADYIRLPVSRDLFLARLRIYFGDVRSQIRSPSFEAKGGCGEKFVEGPLSQVDFGNLIFNLLSLKFYPLSDRAERIRRYARTVLLAFCARETLVLSGPDELADGVGRIALIQELGGPKVIDELMKESVCGRKSRTGLNVPSGFVNAAALALSYQRSLCRLQFGSSSLEIRNDMPLLSQLFLLLDAYDASLFQHDDLSVSSHEQAVSTVLSTAGALVGQRLLEAFSSIGEELRFIALQSHSGRSSLDVNSGH